MIKRDKFKRLLAVVFWLLATAFGLGLVATGSHAGTAYYADLSNTTSTNVGTYANPFRTMAAINAKAFSAGDDLYFKAGTSGIVSDALRIDWDGTSSDTSIIGAYYGENLFGLNGGSRPILDGNNAVGGGGLVYADLSSTAYDGYITIKDLEITKSSGYGVYVLGYKYGVSLDRYVTNITVENCYIHHIGLAAAVMFRGVRNSYIQDNEIMYCPATYRMGSTIDLYGSQNASYPLMTAYNTIRRNVLGYTGSEGINIRYFANYNIVEDNVVYNGGNVTYYCDSGQYNTFRRNVGYADASNRANLRAWGIAINQESHGGSEGKALDSIGNTVYENTLVGMRAGILLQNEGAEDGKTVTSNKIFNNTLIDNDNNFKFDNNAAAWSGNSIKNNISAVYTTGMLHSNNYSPLGVTWGKNLFNTSVSGNASTYGVIGNPVFSFSDNWRAISEGAYLDTNHELTLSSMAIDAGEHLTTIDATEGEANTTMPITDPYYFSVGMYVAADADNDGDVDWVDTVVSIDYANGVVTLEDSHVYTTNGKVWLARSSISEFSGAGIDFGSVEYTNYPNQRPVISQVTPGNITIYPDDLTQTFSCTATDPDGDEVTVAWNFTTSGAYATDSAVAAPGALALIDPGTYPARYTITITATDEHGLSTSTSFDIQIVLDAEESSCQEFYAPSLTDDATLPVSVYNASEFTGGIFKPASNMSVCSVDVKVRARYGSPSGNCHLRFFTLNESDQPATVIATSNAVPFANMSNGTWVSQNAGMFTFDESVTLTSGTEYGYAWFRDTDGNLNDQPEYSGETNRTLFGIDNENDGDGVQLGQYTWTYSASLPYVVKSYDAEDDILIKVHTLQAQSESIVVNRVYAVTPNGTYKEGDSIQLAIEFNLPVALTDANSNSTKNFTGTATVGGQTFTATHSFPAFATEATTHYITGTVPASSSGLLETITLNLNGDAMGTADLTIGAGKNVGSNSEIYFDTSAPAIASFYACDEDGVQITDTTLISTVTSGYVCMESDGDSIFFADGPLGNLTLSLANIVPSVTARYLSGIGTSKLIFQWDSVAGNRGTDAAVAGTDAFDPTPTVLRDQAGNALTLTLPNTWLIDANELNFAVPKNLATATAWWVPTNMATDAPATVVDGDHFILTAASDTFTTTNDNLSFDLPNQAGSYAITLNGDNCTVMGRYGQTITVDGTGTGNKTVYLSPWR